MYVLLLPLSGTKLKGRIYKTTIRRMEGRIYISLVIGDTCSHHRICSNCCFVDTPFKLCTEAFNFVRQLGLSRALVPSIAVL